MNSQQLAKLLLLGIEPRGGHATGFAFRDRSGNIQAHKRNVTASDFVKGHFSLSRHARTAILHTRFATQGSPTVRENNHPLIVGNIVGVHNGMLQNDYEIFKKLAVERPGSVDSSAIFALLNYKWDGTPEHIEDVFSQVYGSAAIGWMSMNDTVRDTLHLARLDGSPLVVATTKSGSTLFASTAETLDVTAELLKIDLTHIRTIEEGNYLRVVEGAVEVVDKFQPNKRYYSYGSYGEWPASVHRRTFVQQPAKKRTLELVGSNWRNDEIDWKPTPVSPAAVASSGRVLPYDSFDIEADTSLGKPSFENLYAKRVLAMDSLAGLAHERSEERDFRPGDYVTTTFGVNDEEWYFGEIVAMPQTFPDGLYTLRLFIPGEEYPVIVLREGPDIWQTETIPEEVLTDAK